MYMYYFFNLQMNKCMPLVFFCTPVTAMLYSVTVLDSICVCMYVSMFIINFVPALRVARCTTVL
jgi:hypothetical protein